MCNRQLDECLLDDYEYAMGVDAWKATFGDIFLDAGDYNRVSGFDDDNSVGGNSLTSPGNSKFDRA